MELGLETCTVTSKLPLPMGAEDPINANGSGVVLAKGERQFSALCMLVVTPEQERVAGPMVGWLGADRDAKVGRWGCQDS